MGLLNLNGMGILELAEALQHEFGGIECEQDLSDRFDSEVMSEVDCACEIDEVAVNEDFSNWADSLREEGEIHESQYEAYGYVGEYS